LDRSSSTDSVAAVLLAVVGDLDGFPGKGRMQERADRAARLEAG
jgi:hypothetical protein